MTAHGFFTHILDRRLEASGLRMAGKRSESMIGSCQVDKIQGGKRSFISWKTNQLISIQHEATGLVGSAYSE